MSYYNTYFYIFTTSFVAPIFEWGLHNLLHKTNNFYHNLHHKEYQIQLHSKKKERLEYEYWPFICIVICYYFQYYAIMFGLLRYYIVHNYIHIYAFNHNNYLLEHHLIHHKYKKYNLCVSATWPDNLFKTLYIKKE